MPRGTCDAAGVSEPAPPQGAAGRSASPFAVPAFRRLYAAQVLALVGTGLTSVALGLLAYDLAGSDAGVVLGTVLALKMVVYVVGAPLLAGVLAHLPRRATLVALDLVRAGAVASMALITEVWQVYVAIVVLNAAAAGFTPAFQATIPELLDDEERYTRALSLSRLAYEAENVLSPALAAALLSVVAFSGLFAVNALTFAASAALVLTTALPQCAPAGAETPVPLVERVTGGVRTYLATPRLRALLAVTLAVAAGSATVIVNTVLYVRDRFGGDDTDVAWALGAAGAGAAVAALAVPPLVARLGDRTVVLAGGATVGAGLAAASLVDGLAWLLGVWVVLGAGLSLAQTPGGRLIQRSTTERDRAAVFAAQFSLSHACWLVTYPVAGIVGATAGLDVAALVLAAVAAVAVVVAARVWPGDAP